MRKWIVFAWDYIFNAEVSPLRHIPDIATRHYVLQALGFMWAVATSVAFGSYALGFANIIGHVALIAAAAVTAATYTTATVKPSLFRSNAGRRADGEHE